MIWTCADDLSGIWSGLTDPRTSYSRSGDFRVDLMHELGHWIVGLNGDLHIEGLGLYGLEHREDGSILVTRGGGVAMMTARPCHQEWVVTNVAGLVAEKLADDEIFRFDDPIGLLSEPVFLHDLKEAKSHLRALGISICDEVSLASSLKFAIGTATSIVRPLMPTLRKQVFALEQLVRTHKSSKLEIEGTAVHHALLTASAPSDW